MKKYIRGGTVIETQDRRIHPRICAKLLFFLLIFSIFLPRLNASDLIEMATLDKGVTRLAVPRATGPTIDCYAVGLQKDKARRVFLVVPGSKCIPLFVYKSAKSRTLSTLMFYDALLDKEFNCNVIGIERRNLKSFQEFSERLVTQKCSDEYGSVEKKDRVADVVVALERIAAQNWVGEIALIGHSEGSDVVCGVAHELGDAGLSALKVKAICCLSSSGAVQFFDHIVESRLYKKQTTQAVFDELLSFTNRTVHGEYRGFPVRRYFSYAIETTPLDEIRRMKIPVFIAHGSDDKNVPIISDDLFAAELFRANGFRRVKYLILDGLDHNYNDSTGESHSGVVLQSVIDWLDNGCRREVETRSWPGTSERGDK
ncbi:MAG: hypothetical protein WA705_21240 [Candidatus Ozemobacteraceae bacterium]